MKQLHMTLQATQQVNHQLFSDTKKPEPEQVGKVSHYFILTSRRTY